VVVLGRLILIIGIMAALPVLVIIWLVLFSACLVLSLPEVVRSRPRYY
jgi:hypothetical protein